MLDLRRRSFLYAGVATLAAGVGVGVALQHQQNASLSEQAAEALWTSEFDAPTGGSILMSGYKGRPLVVNYWATWCPPCVEEMPLIDAFFRQNRSNGWQVVGLAIDQPSKVRQFVSQFPVGYDIGLAGLGGSELGKKLGNEQSSLPFTLVLDAQGQIRQRKLGKLTPDDIKSWVV